MTAVTQDLIHGEGIHPGPSARPAGMAQVLRHWYERAKQRRQLSGLTLRELEDVGISVDAAAAEAAKPFWRA
jgi:uncharacterized protein YjiS (DUF1127 family)